MQKLLSIVVLIAVFALSWSASGAEQSAATKDSTKKTPSSIQTDQKSENEVTLLKEQNKLIREYQGSLLDTVYWALGGVFATTVLLAGFGWWSNFKLYEADKQRLQQDLTAKINELEAKLALRLETNRTELEHAVDARGETQLSRLLSELTDVRTNISRLDNESRQRSDEIKASRQILETEINKINKLVFSTSADLRFVEEFVWDTRDNPSNILLTQCQGIEAAMASENTDRVNNILVRMKDSLTKHFVSNKYVLDKSLHANIQGVLSKLGSENGIASREVLAILNKLPAIS